MKDLPLTANHWGTYWVESDNGKVTRLVDFEQDDDPSPIGYAAVDAQTGPARIDQPMVRKSWLEHGPGTATEQRGAEAFVALSWDEAEKLVADELSRVVREYGNRSIYAGSYGWASSGRFHHAQSQIHRFLNCIGGYTRSKNTYSYAAAEVIMPHVLGGFWDMLINTTSWNSIQSHTNLFVAFGGVTVANGQVNSGGTGSHCQRSGIQGAIESGVDFVSISPLRSDILKEAGAQWLAARPSTDAALMLGIAHTLYVEGLHDQAFLDRYTVGFDRFLPYLTGESDGIAKSADWAADISGISAVTIQELARKMAARRTMISVSWSLTRQDHGEQPVWLGIVLASMLGQIGLPGGGFGFGYSSTNSIGLHYTPIPGASLPQGANPVDDFIPVARVSDMLLNPGASFDYDGGRYQYPDINLVYWAGGNPFHHHQDLNQLLLAWRKPQTIVVHELAWNSLAKHADIVLPCTTPLERTDISISSRDPYVIYMSKVVEPVNDARNDHDIFRGIARHMNVEASFTEGRTEEEWLQWLYDQTCQRAAEKHLDLPDYDTLKRQQWYKASPPVKPNLLLEPFINDPEGKPLNTPSGKIEIFSETIDQFAYTDCLAHPSWHEPAEWLGRSEKKFPLHLVSNQPRSKLHSQFDHGRISKAAKRKQREPVTLHPEDALARNIDDGDLVKVFNQRGSCIAVATISDVVRKGVVQMSTGAWFDPEEPGHPGSVCKHGNPNVVTLDKGTSSLAQGPIAHTCLVDVERYSGEPPKVTAFDPPEILRK